jgi:hypothetical protein
MDTTRKGPRKIIIVWDSRIEVICGQTLELAFEINQQIVGSDHEVGIAK